MPAAACAAKLSAVATCNSLRLRLRLLHTRCARAPPVRDACGAARAVLLQLRCEAARGAASGEAARHAHSSLCVPLAQGPTRASRVVVDTSFVLSSVAVRCGLPSLHHCAAGCASAKPLASAQPGRRRSALAATAGEASESEAEYQGAFFNRKAELESLAAILGDPPTAVLVMTGPPSCGKSGAFGSFLSHSRCTAAW